MSGECRGNDERQVNGCNAVKEGGGKVSPTTVGDRENPTTFFFRLGFQTGGVYHLRIQNQIANYKSKTQPEEKEAIAMDIVDFASRGLIASLESNNGVPNLPLGWEEVPREHAVQEVARKLEEAATETELSGTKIVGHTKQLQKSPGVATKRNLSLAPQKWATPARRGPTMTWNERKLARSRNMKGPSREYYEKRARSKPLLLAIVAGMRGIDRKRASGCDFRESPYKDIKKGKFDVEPKLSHLQVEVERRFYQIYKLPGKPSNFKTIDKAFDWLVEYPITDYNDMQFFIVEITQYQEVVRMRVQEELSRKKVSQGSMNLSRPGVLAPYNASYAAGTFSAQASDDIEGTNDASVLPADASFGEQPPKRRRIHLDQQDEQTAHSPSDESSDVDGVSLPATFEARERGGMPVGGAHNLDVVSPAMPSAIRNTAVATGATMKDASSCPPSTAGTIARQSTKQPSPLVNDTSNGYEHQPNLSSIRNNVAQPRQTTMITTSVVAPELAQALSEEQEDDEASLSARRELFYKASKEFRCVISDLVTNNVYDPEEQKLQMTRIMLKIDRIFKMKQIVFQLEDRLNLADGSPMNQLAEVASNAWEGQRSLPLLNENGQVAVAVAAAAAAAAREGGEEIARRNEGAEVEVYRLELEDACKKLSTVAETFILSQERGDRLSVEKWMVTVQAEEVLAMKNDLFGRIMPREGGRYRMQ